MITETNKMSSFNLILSLIFLVVHHGVVAAIHAEKPMIYINFFDEIVSDNASSKLVKNALTTTSTPLVNNSKTDIRKKIDFPAEHLKLDNENKTSVPYYSIFEFDNPSKVDITETAVNESDTDSSTTGRLTDMIDPDLLESDFSRIFFLKVITNMIAHIMEALFSIDEASKPNESPDFEYEPSAPSRKLKKRDLTENSIKSNDVNGSTSENVQSVELKTEFTTVDSVSTSDTSTSAIHRNKNTATSSNISPKHLKLHEKLAKNVTENSSHTQSTTHASDHNSIHHGTHKVTNKKPEGNIAKSTAGVKNQHETDVHPEGKVVSNKKHFVETDSTKKPVYVDEDEGKMSHFKDESAILNDEVVNKKDNHFYGGVHPAEYHDGYRFDENSFDEEGDYNDKKESSSLLTLLLISTTVMILMILVAFGLTAVYFFRKNQIQPGNQNASNLSRAVA